MRRDESFATHKGVSLENYYRQHLVTVHPNGTYSGLKERTLDQVDPTTVCIRIPRELEQGKRLNKFILPVTRLLRELQEEKDKIGSIGKKKKRAKKKTRKEMAKHRLTERYPGLKVGMLDWCERFAAEYLPGSPQFVKKQRKMAKEKAPGPDKFNVLIDENISPYLTPHFQSNRMFAFNVTEANLRGCPDKALFLKEGVDIIITHDDDFLNMVQATCVDLIADSGQTGVDTRMLPFIVHIQSRSEGRPQAAEPEEPEAEAARDGIPMTKGERRDVIRERERISDEFQAHKYELEQIKSLARHRDHILGYCADPDRHVIAVSLARDGELKRWKKSTLIDNHFILCDPENELAAQIVLDGRPCVLSGKKIKSKTIKGVFDKARIVANDVEQLRAEARRRPSGRPYAIRRRFTGPRTAGTKIAKQ